MQAAGWAGTGGVGATGPSKDQGSGGSPNALVAHLEQGLAVLHLADGRLLCQLHLASPGLHADLNGDGVPDHVSVGPMSQIFTLWSGRVQGLRWLHSPGSPVPGSIAVAWSSSSPETPAMQMVGGHVQCCLLQPSCTLCISLVPTEYHSMSKSPAKRASRNQQGQQTMLGDIQGKQAMGGNLRPQARAWLTPQLQPSQDGSCTALPVQVMGGDGDEAMSDTGHRHGRHCWVSATSGIPPQQPLFNGSACASSHPLLQLYTKSDAARKLAMHTQARSLAWKQSACVTGLPCATNFG